MLTTFIFIALLLLLSGIYTGHIGHQSSDSFCTNDDEGLPVVLPNLMDGADVRAIQCRGRTSFTPKAFEHLRVFGEVLWQELQNDEATKLGVLGVIDNTRPTATELFEDAVVRYGLAD